MRKEQRSRQQPGNPEFTAPNPMHDQFILGSNSRLIYPGEPKPISEPIRGTGRSRRSSNGKKRRR